MNQRSFWQHKFRFDDKRVYRVVTGLIPALKIPSFATCLMGKRTVKHLVNDDSHKLRMG